MAVAGFEVKVRIAWWFIYGYLPAIKCLFWLLTCAGLDVEPRRDRIHFWLEKAVRIESAKPNGQTKNTNKHP